MKLKKTWLVILLLSLLVCSGCNKKTEQENVETKQETESIPEKEEIRPSGYIKDEILQYFKLSETELESWNKIEKIREYAIIYKLLQWYLLNQVRLGTKQP